MISIKNLQKSFDGQIILKGVSLNVEKGERVVIVGPSGSGKSTLLRCINLLENPDGGEIWLDDKTISKIDPYLHDDLIKESLTYQKLLQKESQDGVNQDKTIIEKIKSEKLLKKNEGKSFKKLAKKMEKDLRLDVNVARRRVTMVFQHFNLFNNMTVLKNLMYAPVKLGLLTEEEATEKAKGLLKRIELLDKADVFPSLLSGGQKQRVAIIRSLMVSPEVILFDEPTSALDPIMVGEVLSLVKELASDGLSMVIVSHEIGFAKEVATKIVFMSDGLILESDSPKEFFKNPKTEEVKDFLSKVL